PPSTTLFRSARPAHVRAGHGTTPSPGALQSSANPRHQQAASRHQSPPYPLAPPSRRQLKRVRKTQASQNTRHMERRHPSAPHPYVVILGFREIGRATSELQSRENLVCRLLLEK